MKNDLFNTRQAVRINDLPARASGLAPADLDNIFGGWWPQTMTAEEVIEGW